MGRTKTAKLPKGTQPKPASKVKAKKKEEADDATLTEASEKIKIDWADHELNTALLNAITSHTDIKQGLYPSPGGTMSSIKSGGNKKTVWQWKLAVILFQDHEKYGKSFSLALTCPDTRMKAKLQAAWGERIKNRLNRMATIAREHSATLGQTGAGITHASDVDMSQDNAFTNKWAEIIAECPWFLEMRDLIAERPNLVPTGIGNSATVDDIDLTVLSKDNETDGGTEPADAMSEGFDVDTTSDGLGILDDELSREIEESSAVESDRMDVDEVKSTFSKRKAPPSDASEVEEEKEELKQGLKTSARPNTSKPAAPVPKKKKSRLEEFNGVAQAEETTRQKELEFNKVKIEASARIKIEMARTQREAVQAKVELKKQERASESEKRRFEHELKLEKLQYKRERMRLKAQKAVQSSSNDFGFSDFGAGPSNAAHDDYSGYVPATIQNTLLPPADRQL